MENIEFTRFIERYLDNKMQAAEKSWFEKEMEGNLLLRKELELRRKANEVASNFDAIKLREKLMNAEKRHRSTSLVEKAVKKVPVNYAAIFIGLIIISSLVILSGNKINLSDITKDTISSYNTIAADRSGVIDVAVQFNSGMDLYKSGNYEEAIVLFEKIRSGDKSNIQATFFSGVSKMQVEKYPEAIESLNQVVEHNDNLFIEDATYFLGLCYMNIENNEKAKTIFEGIISQESKYKKDAKKLLRKIN